MTNAETFLAQFPDAIEAAQAHARAVFPEESCGFIVKGRYIALENTASDPEQHEDAKDCGCRLCAFSVSDSEFLKHQPDIQAIVHSHPNGPIYPSKLDMAQQEATDLPWIIVSLNDRQFGPITVWGGNCPIEPLVGREFLHGINDCYSLIRDVFAIGKDKLAEEGIEWPFGPINLPLYPRADSWWEADEDNFYEEKPQQIGFEEISVDQVRPGDVFLCSIRADRLNHGGVLLGNNLIMHHLPQRLSRREPAGLWARAAEKWIRYVGPENA